MSDLISRADAVKYLMTNMNWYDEDEYETDEDEKRMAITDLINGVPSAQSEIIRCKDCKYHGTDYCHHPRMYGNHFLAGDDDFCSWAEQEVEG